MPSRVRSRSLDLNIGLELIIVTQSTKTQGTPKPKIECCVGKIYKTHSPRCTENTFPEIFHIKLSFLHLISNGLNGININSLTYTVLL